MGKKERKAKKFKGLTDNQEHIVYVGELVKQGKNITHAVIELCNKLNYPYSDSLRRAFSKQLGKRGVTESKKEVVSIEQSDEYKEALSRELPKSKYYIVTWAQAETEVHKPFWENMKAYADFIGAEIIVQAGRYKSPTSLEANERVKDRERGSLIWAKELQPYLYASRLNISEKLEVLCDVKVQPTAILPISGLNGFTADSSCILPHPKVQLQSLPILEGYNHKLILSTGAVTLPNYTDTKAGKKGEFHHQLGFVIVEIDSDKRFHLRQVQADDSGDFIDLWNCVKGCCVYDYRRDYDGSGSEDYSIVWGDLHVRNRDPKAVDLAISLSQDLKVKNVILHDLLDAEAINHHEERDPFRLLYKEDNKLDDLEAEIAETLNALESYITQVPTATFHNIASNHSDFIDRWLRDVDWRKVRNKRMYLKLANVVAEGKAPKGVLNYLLSINLPEVKTYGYGDSLRIKGWELALHGDLGVNGSRGGIKQFKNLSTKTITAHSHSPQRQDGSIVAGTLTKLRLSYNKGLSSWVQGVVLIYPNGKATNIHFIDYKYTTLK